MWLDKTNWVMFQLPVPICENLRSSAVGLCSSGGCRIAPEDFGGLSRVAWRRRIHSRAFAVAIVFLIANAMMGCAGDSTQRTEDLLSAAGFNVVIASTPQRLILFGDLPPYKVIRIQRNGKDRYVYADPAQKLIYVGGVFAYQRLKITRGQEPGRTGYPGRRIQRSARS